MKRLPLLIRMIAVIGVAVALSQCASETGAPAVNSASPAASQSVQASTTAQEQSGADASAASPAYQTAAGASKDYRIGDRDSLQITVFQVPDLSSKGVLVDGQGDVVMPLIGAVHVAGLTTDEASKRIAKKLGKTYLQNPQVFVVLQQSAKRIIVSGAVAKPTAIPPTGSLNSEPSGRRGGWTVGRRQCRSRAYRAGQRAQSQRFCLQSRCDPCGQGAGPERLWRRHDRGRRVRQ